MVIRCPHCQFSRSITLDKIPATAEVATCPKCNKRFQFRTIPKKIIPELHQNLHYDQQSEDTPHKDEFEQHQHNGHESTQSFTSPEAASSQQAVQAVKGKTKEQAPKKDIWDALGSLTKLWEKEKKSETSTDESSGTPAPLEEKAALFTEQEAVFGNLEQGNAQDTPTPDFVEEAYPPYLQKEGEESSISYSPSSTEESPQPKTPRKRSSPLLPKDDEDVEIHIHYVDGKPASFRNPWAKKNDTPPEEASQEFEQETDTYQPEADQLDTPHARVSTGHTSFEHSFESDNAPHYPGYPDSPHAPLSSASPDTQNTPNDVESTDFEGHETELHDETSSSTSAPTSHLASPKNIYTDSHQAPAPARTRKRADKPERPLTPLENLMAQDAQEDSPPSGAEHDSFATIALETPTASVSTHSPESHEYSLGNAQTEDETFHTIGKPSTGFSDDDTPPANADSLAATPATSSESFAPESRSGDVLDASLPADETTPDAPETVGSQHLATEEAITTTSELQDEGLQDAKPYDIASGIEANKPFDYKDTTPEERVEKDLCFLQTNTERPTKELGMLREIQPENTLSPFSETREIPWEHPQTYGVFSSLLRTIKSVMFSAPAFFRTIPPLGGMAFAFLFFILHGYLAVMCTTFWIILAAVLFDLPSLGHVQDLVPTIALFTPVALSLLLIAATSFTRIFLILFQRQQATFAFTFKLLCYSIAPLLLSIIPFIGPIAGLIWSFIILGTACHHSTGLSPVRAIIAITPTCLLTLWLLFLLLP